MGYQLLSYTSSATQRAGILIGDVVCDAAGLLGDERYATVFEILQDWDVTHPRLAKISAESGHKKRSDSFRLDELALSAPLPNPGQVYAAGANYIDHIDEMNRSMPPPPVPTMKEIGEKPWHFIKAGRGAVVGPNASVRLPAHSQRVDWELELAVVIGRRAKDVAREKALSYVAGYTIGNDLSARDNVFRKGLPEGSPFRFDFVSQKSFDGSCPLGPWITPASDIPNPDKLAMKLWLNDTLMQDSNTSNMIFDVSEQIEMLSSRITLYPGDIILTGTPAGVGMGRGLFLKSGDRLRLWIEQIGEFTHGIA